MPGCCSSPQCHSSGRGRWLYGRQPGTPEQPIVVLGGDPPDFLDRNLSQSGNSRGHVGHPAGLIGLAPIRHRGQIGRIGLDQQAAARYLSARMREAPGQSKAGIAVEDGAVIEFKRQRSAALAWMRLEQKAAGKNTFASRLQAAGWECGSAGFLSCRSASKTRANKRGENAASRSFH